MAKGKRSKGNSYTSKGERRNVSKATTKMGRREYMASPDRIYNQTMAYISGKRVAKSFVEAFGKTKRENK